MPRVSRRTFGKAAVAAAATLAAPRYVRGRNLNDKLNIAMIATGRRGAHNLKQVGSANDAAAVTYPSAKKFADFRRVFDQPAGFDAVVVSTCEHTHAAATMLALK